ncbi:MAG TPA: ATP-binding protein, partial [Thermoanaerobaculia bacterium]|nr:ATP-binding protein [Thermoanaerobaculia bacterium]
AAGERASELTHELLTFSRRQVLRPQLVDVNDELLRLQPLLRPTLGEDVRLELALAQELPPVRIDPAQLEQVIVNLAVNARDAMPGGGDLTLATERVTAPATAANDGDGAAPWVRLRVRDTGVGMSADVLAHLFEPFFTTKERGRGTGLGLSSVYGAVRQSGGEVRVESAPGEGTTFDVLLPPAEVAVAGEVDVT